MLAVPRRFLLGLAALLLLPAASQGARPTLRPDDMTLGDARAPVVVVEYASLSCPHCALFHKTVFPAFRKKYVDSGKVLFVYREYITNPAEVAVPAAAIARCGGKERYFPMLSRIFGAQEEIYKVGTLDGMRAILRREALAAGITEDAFDACITSQAAYDAVQARSDRAFTEDGIQGTPTFVVNGKRIAPPLNREMDLATLDKAIAEAK
jgi:protein-disulfide isomerase